MTSDVRVRSEGDHDTVVEGYLVGDGLVEVSVLEGPQEFPAQRYEVYLTEDMTDGEVADAISERVAHYGVSYTQSIRQTTQRGYIPEHVAEINLAEDHFQDDTPESRVE